MRTTRFRKAGSLTLAEAREAARVAKTARPALAKLSPAKRAALWERYLGHFGPPVRKTVAARTIKATAKKGAAREKVAAKRTGSRNKR